MAEPTGPTGPELDAVLRDAFQRTVQPGDSAGVADAIRSRVAAGDTGTSVAAATAPGWGAGVASWLPWLGLVVGAGVVGGGLGVAGVFAPADEAVASPYHVVQVTTPGYQCPEGPVVTELGANERVLAVARDEESAWLQVRDPRDLATLVWLPTRVVTVDAGQDVAGLPVGEGCPEEVEYEIEPESTPDPVETQQPQQPQPGGPADPPAPPADTTAPQIVQSGGNHTFIYSCPSPQHDPKTVTLSIVATDDVGVTGATVSWSGAASGSAPMSSVGGGEWRYTFDPSDTTVGNVSFQMRARDAAGNQSAPAGWGVFVNGCVS